MTTRTFAEIFARLELTNFEQHPADLVQLTFSLEQVYNTSFQTVWNNWLD